jgi:DNA mismatch repair protein MutL
MVSKFPAVILNLEIPAELVDINVHPTKLECKFSNEQDIYQAVYHAVKSTLYALPNVPQIEHNPLKTSRPEAQEQAEQKSIEELFREKLQESKLRKQELSDRVIPKTEETAKETRVKEPAKELQRDIYAVQPDENPKPIDDKDYKFDAFSMLDFAVEHAKKYDNALKVKSPAAQEKGEDIDTDWMTYLQNAKRANANRENIFADGYFRVIGQVFETYILVEKGENLLMIDQHAAHERLNYEALKKEIENTGIMQQMILEPIEIKLHPNEYEVYTENKDEFSKLGFECQATEDIITITAIPGDISWSDGEPLFLELLSQMSDMKNSIISERKERLLYTISCKASIKANMKISQQEMENLVSKVFALENINTCPHGRPIVISLSKSQIEKDFRRIT